MSFEQVRASEAVEVATSELQQLSKALDQLRETLDSLKGRTTNQGTALKDAVRNLRGILDEDIIGKSRRMSVDCIAASAHILTQLDGLRDLNANNAYNSLRDDIVSLQQTRTNVRSEIRALQGRVTPFTDIIDQVETGLVEQTPQPRRHKTPIFSWSHKHSAGKDNKIPLTKALKTASADFDGVLGALRIFEDFHKHLHEELEALSSNNEFKEQDVKAVTLWLKGMSDAFSEYRDLVV
ncbi:hypothetical protein QCA50_013607 [Cerrena zonata]|uniref:Uncharacterized protein n=1 Tax=Cerrena zonata TaxID=2478898 RepID=A0AAW0FWR6_9APHY